MYETCSYNPLAQAAPTLTKTIQSPPSHIRRCYSAIGFSLCTAFANEISCRFGCTRLKTSQMRRVSWTRPVCQVTPLEYLMAFRTHRVHILTFLLPTQIPSSSECPSVVLSLCAESKANQRHHSQCSVVCSTVAHL
jgi:hypothetical protein